MLLGMILGVAGSLAPGGHMATASHTCEGGPQKCGQNSGVVPFRKDAIHASVIRTRGESECAEMLIWMRPSEYKPKDYVVDPTGPGALPTFNPKFVTQVQGGFDLGRLDRSGWSRNAPDLERENTQLINMCGLQALIDAGAFTKTNITDLTDKDFKKAAPFFRDAGFSRGLSYNLFCAGNAAGIDGRVYVFGIHDKGGNNGGRKVNIFDPKTERWVSRGTTCVRSGWATNPSGTIPPNCNPIDETKTDPPIPSDMKYQRWYPTVVTLPDGRMLILSGTDTDTSLGDTRANAESKVRQPVPEVYDPKTDTTIALKNSWKLLPMYVRAFVVQTGPGKKDWKVAVLAEFNHSAAGGPFSGDTDDIDRGIRVRGYDPWPYIGNTYLFDVQAALEDPLINVHGKNHWYYVDTAQNAHDSGASAMRVRIYADGTWSQEVFSFGGDNGSGADSVATVEKINFAAAVPAWQQLQDLERPSTQNNVVFLANGKLLVVGGRREATFHYQMFDPDTGTRTDLIESPVPRHDHSTALAEINGGVWVMGGNRVELIPGGHENDAVPVMEYYRPPYFFKGPRPVIAKAPKEIDYGTTFELRVTGEHIKMVNAVRNGPITHNWAWGNQLVQLPFVVSKTGSLEVTAPPLPGLAIAGDYMLFVVDKYGVPSKGKFVRLNSAD